MTNEISHLKNMFASKQTGSATTKILQEIYADLAKPSVVSIGKAISVVAETSTTLLLPLKLWHEKKKLIFQHNLKKLELELVEAEKEGKTVIPAAPEVANSLLEKLTYISDDDLSALFVKLLRRASVEEESALAHPRFAEIVSCISPDEARILTSTSGEDYFRCLSTRWEKTEEEYDGVATTSFYTTDRCLTGLEKKTTILFPENIYKYLVSLQSLGLIAIQEDATLDEYLTPSHEYDELRAIYKSRAKDGVTAKDGHISRVTHGRIQYTEFGLFFLEACVIEKEGQSKKNSGVVNLGTKITASELKKRKSKSKKSGNEQDHR